MVCLARAHLTGRKHESGFAARHAEMNGWTLLLRLPDLAMRLFEAADIVRQRTQ